MRKLGKVCGKENEKAKTNKIDVEGGNGSAIKKSIALVKRRLHFRITAKLENSKR